MTTDQQLLQRLASARQRDAAMRELVATYGQRLYARCVHIVGQAADADDVFQNTLIKVVRNASKFEGGSQLYSWLYRIATNESLDFLRKRERTRAKARKEHVVDLRTESLGANYADDDIQAGTLNAEATNALLLRAIDELPDMQRLVFEERYFHETPYASLAEKYGRSVGGLKANYHHAVRKVTDYLRAHAQIAYS